MPLKTFEKQDGKYRDILVDKISKLYGSISFFPKRYFEKDGRAKKKLYQMAEAFAESTNRETNFPVKDLKEVFIIYAYQFIDKYNKNAYLPVETFKDYAEKAVEELYSRVNLDRSAVLINLLSKYPNMALDISYYDINSVFPLLNENIQKRVAELLKKRFANTFYSNIEVNDVREEVVYKFYFDDKGNNLYLKVNDKYPQKIDLPVSYKMISPFFDIMTEEQKAFFSLANKVYRTLNHEVDPIYSAICNVAYESFQYEGSEVDALKSAEAHADHINGISNSARNILKDILKQVALNALQTESEIQLEEISDNAYLSFNKRIKEMLNDVSL